MITRRLVRWLDARLGFSALARSGLNKVFPDHWSFAFGEIALYSFVFLVFSGIYLTFFFDPSEAKTVYMGTYAPLHGSEVSSAYSSAVDLSYDVRAGLLMRQAHHWAALIFIGAMVVHLSRVFLTGAFRRPREINWVIGVTMLVLAIVNGFAGYSMPDDLLSGTGLRIVNAVLLSVPVVGEWLSYLVFGGTFPGDQILHRLYITHVLLVPVLLGVLITAHMGILVRQKHSQFPGPGRTEHNVVGSRLWPGYAVKSIGLLFAVFSVCLLLGGLAQINPIWLYGPFEPGSTTSPAQPDWYVGWVDGALRLYPAWEPHIFGYRLPAVFVPAIVLPLVTFLAVYAWPFVEPFFTKDRAPHQVLERPRDRPFRVAVLVWALSFYGLLLASWSDDVIARFTYLPVSNLMYGFRVIVVVAPLVLGWIALVLARGLLRSDAPALLSLGWRGVLAGVRRRPPAGSPPAEAEPSEQAPSEQAPSEQEPAEQEAAEQEVAAALDPPPPHLPVEVGPVA